MSAVIRPSLKLVNETLLLLRLGIGFVFALAGYAKLGILRPATISMFSAMMGLPPESAEMLTLVVGWLELLSGIFIAIGLLTRLAALYQLVTLGVAISVIAGFDFSKVFALLDAGLLPVCLTLLLLGAGRYSVDAAIKKPRQ